MRFGLNSQVKQLNKRQRRKGIWRRIVTVMSVIVVFCTTYALILPAITVGTDEKCGMQEHLHMDSCYSEDGAVVCEITEHSHNAQCYVDVSDGEATPDSAEPYDIAPFALSDDAASDADTPTTFAVTRASAANSDVIPPSEEHNRYYSNVYMFYEFSPYLLDDNTSEKAPNAIFALAPVKEEEYDWCPYPTTDWTAYCESNYEAAYCCDINTSTSGDGDVYYDKMLMSAVADSRLSDSQKERVSALIRKAYPFLSRAEVESDMKDAKYTLSSGCKLGEFVSGTQWAIWEIVNKANISGCSGDASWTVSDPTKSQTIHPLTDYRAHNYTNRNNINSDIKAIHDYLIKVANETQAEGYDKNLIESEKEFYITDKQVKSITPNDDGTCTVTVTVTMNRALSDYETAQSTITDSQGNTSTIEIPHNTQSFDITLNDTYNNASYIDVTIDSDSPRGYMEVYFYEGGIDGGDYQDMVGGKVVPHSDKARVGFGDVTSVSVNKQWVGDIDVDEVEVYLYANGKKTGDVVTLNSSNNWSYKWEDLYSGGLAGDIEYTVKEKPVPGYRISVTSTTDSQYWERASEIEDGSTYMFVNGSAALSKTNADNEYLEMTTVDVDDAKNTSNLAMWTATASGSGFNFTNVGKSDRTLALYSKSSYYSTTRHFVAANGSSSNINTRDLNYSGNYLKASNYGLGSISNGYGTAVSNGGTAFTAYKLINGEKTTFTITNTKVDEVTSISAEKIWKDENGNNLEETPDSIEVNLLADGKQYGDSVVLDKDNNWQYQWTGLPKTDADGNEINYTVDEVAVEGFDSAIEKTESETLVDQKIWKQSTTLEDGKTYLFVNGSNALAKTNADNEYLEMASVDINDAENTSSLSMWKATASGSGFNLTNAGKTDRTLAFYSRRSGWSTTRRFVAADPNSSTYYYTKALTYSNGYITSSDYKLGSISSGYGSAATNSGTAFTLYELSQQEVTTTETRFVITNTKIAETVGLKIRKADYNNTDKMLQGAVFDVYRETGVESDGVIPLTDNKYGIKIFENVTTDENGEISIEGLSQKVSYYLIETTAPDGYNKLNVPVEFKLMQGGISVADTEMSIDVSQDNENILLVKNEEGYTLPQTGSVGTIWFTFGGSLMILSAILLVYKKRSKERCESL